MHFGSDGKLYVGVGENANARAGAEPDEPVRQAAALQRGRHDPDRQPVLRHAERPGARDLGLGPAQPVHLRGAARHRPDPHQRRRPGHLGGDQPRRGRRQLRLAGLRRARATSSPASPRRSSPTGTATPARPARARAASSPASRSPAAPSIRRAVRSPRATATSTTSPISSASSSAGSTLANGNAAYAFARLSAPPVDLLVGIDGALYVLTRGGITRISAP